MGSRTISLALAAHPPSSEGKLGQQPVPTPPQKIRGGAEVFQAGSDLDHHLAEGLPALQPRIGLANLAQIKGLFV